MYVASVSCGARWVVCRRALPEPPLISPEPCFSRSRDGDRPRRGTRSNAPSAPPGFATATCGGAANSGMNRDTDPTGGCRRSRRASGSRPRLSAFDDDAEPEDVVGAHRRALRDVGVAVASKCTIRPRRATSVTTPAISPASMCLLHGRYARKALGRHADVLGFARGQRTGCGRPRRARKACGGEGGEGAEKGVS